MVSQAVNIWTFFTDVLPGLARELAALRLPDLGSIWAVIQLLFLVAGVAILWQIWRRPASRGGISLEGYGTVRNPTPTELSAITTLKSRIAELEVESSASNKLGDAPNSDSSSPSRGDPEALLRALLEHRQINYTHNDYRVTSVSADRMRIDRLDASGQVAMSGALHLERSATDSLTISDVVATEVRKEAPSPAPRSRELDADEDRIEIDVTPEHLWSLFEGRTGIQGESLVEPFIGKWMRLAGPLGDVGRISEKWLQVTFRYGTQPMGKHVYIYVRDKRWIDRVVLLKIGDEIVVLGRIERVSAMEIRLDHCVLVAP